MCLLLLFTKALQIFKCMLLSVSQSVQSLSHVQLFATLWIAARQASLSITNTQSSPKPMFIELVMPSNHLILCHPLLLLPWVFPRIKVFSNESAPSHQVAKGLEFQLQHQSFQWTPRTDLLPDGLVWSPCSPRDPQEYSLTSQFKSINSWYSVQLSHPYMTIGKP